jgi:two-component system capsular synthesis response regulator RcsB
VGVRIVVADGHEIVRIGLRTLFQHGREGYEIVAEASNGSELLHVLAHTPSDLVIVDFLMQGEDMSLDGVVLLRELRRRHPTLRVVVLTMLRNLAIFRTMYREGAAAVVEKASMVDELLVALRTVRAGRTYVSRQLGEHLIDASNAAVDKHEEHGGAVRHLSAREAEVVRLFAQGLALTEIAAFMHRSVKTISRQKRNAMLKLGLTNDRQLFEYARMHGLYGE